MKEKNSNNLIISLGVVSFFLGIIILSSNYLNSKIEKSYNDMNLKVLALNTDELLEEVNNNTDTEIEEILSQVSSSNILEKEEKVETINYIGSLSIPKISLNHGFVSENSKYNSIKYGIQIIKGSTYPNVNKGNLILVSHSGSSYISLFKNLYKLTIGDHCYINYGGKNYHYVITDIYNKPKIGKIAINRNFDKTTLTLITCDKNNDKEQTVYIAEMI